MENSKQTLSSSNNNQRTDEESGWTTYFDDYFTNNNNREFSSSTDCCFSDFESSSSISDAASGTLGGLKFSVNNQNMERSINSRQISFKKRRTRDVVAFDDALEDTASSPVNSPKVSDLKKQQVYVNPRKKDANINSSQGTASVHCSDFQNDKGLNELGSSFGRENEYTQLKKRGLCLVPLSMLVNYIG